MPRTFVVRFSYQAVISMRTLLFVLLALSSSLLARPAMADCECPARDVVVIGHRGAGSSGTDEAFPENTIESAQQAFVEGADMVEIDVQISADGAVVLMHDDTVDRTTEGSGCVSALSLDEMRALGVPTLPEFLAAVEGAVNIEIKLHETDECPGQDLEALVDAVIADVQAASAEDRVLVSSFALDVLQRLRANEPSIPIGYLSYDANDIDVAAAEGFEAVHLLSVVANARNVRRAHDAGVRVNVWTVNGENALRTALAAQPDGLITDTADEAVAARAAFCEEYVCPGADAGVGGAADGGADPAPSGGCRAAAHGGSAPIACLLVFGAALLIRKSARRAGY